ncbi:MAG: thiosulfate sulfurtransferase GlpE [Halopseudomonas sp.]
MTEFKQIDINQAQQLLDKGAALADIRDQDSYLNRHISGAVHLDNQNLQQFIDEADLDAPVLIYCYHGMSSQSAAQFLIERGFDEVYSLAGGFEAWQQAFPERCQQG